MKSIILKNSAEKYDSFIKKSFSAEFIEKPIVRKYLKPVVNNKTRALDLGCGSGHSIAYLTDLGIREKNILGIDKNSKLLRLAEQTFPDVEFVKGDISNMKLQKPSFDLVISIMAFHYLSIKKYRKTVKIVSDILKKGGFLFFITLHPLRYRHDYSDYFSNKPRKERTGWGSEIKYYHKTMSKYLNSLIEFGLEIVAIEEPMPLGRFSQEKRLKYKEYSTKPRRLVVMAVKK